VDEAAREMRVLRMRLLPTLAVTLLLSTAPARAAVAQIVLKPASPAKTQRLMERTRALAEGEPKAAAKLGSEMIIVGPRLLSRLDDAMRGLIDGPRTRLLIEDGDHVARWGLTPLDPTTPTDTVDEKVRSSAPTKGRVVVEAGIVKANGRAFLSGMQRLMRSDGHRVREATDAELEYYWALVPYDLEAPVLTIVAGDSSYLVDFDDGGRIVFIELLPTESIPR
jgi:hypothetical protein